MPAKMFNYVNVVGVLRKKRRRHQDVPVPWIPAASGSSAYRWRFLGALVWRLPIYTVYALVMTEEVYKAVLGYIRYRQKKWLGTLSLDVGESGRQGLGKRVCRPKNFSCHIKKIVLI